MRWNCVHNGRSNGDLVLCRHFEEWRAFSQCHSCPAFSAGTALPLTHEESTQDKTSACRLLGPVITEEPCSCGSMTKVSIHECQSPARVRHSGEPGVCVPLQSNWDRLADPDAARFAQCCESCEHRLADTAVPTYDSHP